MDTKTKNTPKDICVKGIQVFDCCFHPRENYLSVACITGSVEIYKVASERNGGNILMSNLLHHTSSCRGVIFTKDGNNLISISSDLNMEMY